VGGAIRGDNDVSAAQSHARGISGVDGVNAACASRDDDIDTRVKQESAGGAAGAVVGIDVDAARWIRLIGVAGDGGWIGVAVCVAVKTGGRDRPMRQRSLRTFRGYA